MKKLAVWKKLLIVLGSLVAVVAIVAASVFGTVAYLTASSKVSNVFTVGDVYLEMFESKVTSEGQIDEIATPPGTKKNSDGNSYHLVPGKSYAKDPTIYVQAGSEASYLFLLVRNDIKAIEDPTKTTMAQQLVANGWVQYTYAKPSTGTTAWVYHGITDGTVNAKPTGVEGGTAGEAINTFSEFHIASNADVSLYGGAGVTLTAIGIQTAGFTDTVNDSGEVTKTAVDAAWDAVVKTYPFIYDIEHGTTTTPNT